MKEPEYFLKKQRGFTLIETVISMAILGAILLSVNMFMKPVTDLWVMQAFRDGAQNEARLALLRMVREISEIKDPASVSIAEAAKIKFTTAKNESITIRRDGTNLLRNDKMLASSIDLFELKYWDNAGAAIANPAVSPQDTNIYRVQISIRASSNGRASTMRSQVRPRNLYG